MTTDPALSVFVQRLGHVFAQPALLTEALTHPSEPRRPDHRRLEFLGDRVCGLLIAEALLGADPAATPKVWAPQLSALVSAETCAEIARELGLDQILVLRALEPRGHASALADALEAVIGAVYVDAGLDAARAVVLRAWRTRLMGGMPVGNAKGALQERVARDFRREPAYHVVSQTGPDHAPWFVVEVATPDGRTAQGEGPSKRAAEDAAAWSLLAQP